MVAMWMIGLVVLGWLLLAAACVYAARWVILRLPEDYLTRATPPCLVPEVERRLGPTGWRIAKNLAGITLIAAGIPMLITPGPGIGSMAFGLLLLDVPGKNAVRRAILHHPRVIEWLNGVRARASREPLRAPHAAVGMAAPHRRSVGSSERHAAL